MVSADVTASTLEADPSLNACEPIVAKRPRPAPEPWVPPHEDAELSDTLSLLTGSTPFEVSLLLDGVADTLGALPLSAMDTPGLLHPLQNHLTQPMTISIANEACASDADIARRLVRSDSLRSSPLPGEPAKAQGHVRQLGWVITNSSSGPSRAQYMKGSE